MEKILITYVSQTGNTQKIAEAIFESISKEKEIMPLQEVDDLEKYSLIFLGFPIHQKGPHPKAKRFLKKAKDKKIALFVTHAAPPEAPFLGTAISKCKECVIDSELVGLFDCQGELAQKVANMLLNSNNQELQYFGKMRDTTIGHPNEEELNEARKFAKEMLNSI